MQNNLIILLGILAAAALGGLIYLFLSKKSSRVQKMAALGALILSGLALGICGVFLIFSGGSEAGKDPYALPSAAEQPKTSTNIRDLLVLLVVLLLFFGFIIILGMRERKKHKLDMSKDNLSL